MKALKMFLLTLGVVFVTTANAIVPTMDTTVMQCASGHEEQPSHMLVTAISMTGTLDFAVGADCAFAMNMLMEEGYYIHGATGADKTVTYTMFRHNMTRR